MEGRFCKGTATLSGAPGLDKARRVLLIKAIRRVRCEEASFAGGILCEDVEGYFLHLSLQEISDPQLRERLVRFSTGPTHLSRSGR